MGKEKTIKTLFFIEGITATDAELAAIKELQPGVLVRAASKVQPGEPIEPFDRVAGAVPQSYKDSDGKPAPFKSRAEKRAELRNSARSEPKTDEPPTRRRQEPVAANLPSSDAPAGTPQGSAWGAAAPTPPAPTPAPAPTGWQRNS